MRADLDQIGIGFIGAGRLGKALAWHCHRRGLKVLAAASLLPSEAEELVRQVPGCRVATAYVDAIARFDPQRLPLYQELCERTVQMALAARRIDPPTAARVPSVLHAAEGAALRRAA